MRTIFFALGMMTAIALTANPAVDFETTIVVMDGKALLVDLNESGQIVTTYMEVENYFDDSKDHATKVKEAKVIYKKLTEQQMDQIRFIAFTSGEELDDVMIANLSDLTMHYQQTYANQIVITAPKNRRTAKAVEANIEKIREVLLQFGVHPNDIKIDYKIDMGDEPTQFVKVKSGLRSLPVQ